MSTDFNFSSGEDAAVFFGTVPIGAIKGFEFTEADRNEKTVNIAREGEIGVVGHKIKRNLSIDLVNDSLDPGQNLLRKYYNEKTKLTDVKCYPDYNEADFWALDIASNNHACMQVKKPGGREKAKSDDPAAESTAELTLRGEPIMYDAHITADTIAFVAGSGSTEDSITDSGSGFITAGFKVGDSLIISGTTSNNVLTHKIKAVEAGILTLETIGAVTDETAGTSFTLHGGQFADPVS